MATDNLSYRELVDHNELMSAIREALSKAKELYDLYSPQVLDEHNISSVAHMDIRQRIQELSATLDSYRSSLSAHTSDNTSGLATVATTGSYNDLINKPIIPTVNNAVLTIQKNGTTVNTFTANASSNVTADITVPTKVSELTNDSGFLTSHQSLSNYSTKTDTIKSLSISGKTITCTKGDNTTDTLTTQDTTYSAGSNLSLNNTTFNVSNTPSFTSITIGGYTITID